MKTKRVCLFGLFRHKTFLSLSLLLHYAPLMQNQAHDQALLCVHCISCCIYCRDVTMTTSTQQSLASSLRSLPCPLVMSQQFAALLLLLTPNIPPKSLKKHPSVFPSETKCCFFCFYFVFVLLRETNATPSSPLAPRLVPVTCRISGIV